MVVGGKPIILIFSQASSNALPAYPQDHKDRESSPSPLQTSTFGCSLGYRFTNSDLDNPQPLLMKTIQNDSKHNSARVRKNCFDSLMLWGLALKEAR